jgi:hypothetical protein
MPPAARYLLIAAVSFLSNGCDSFYVKENCQRFIDEMLHLGETDVLARYLALLGAQARPDRGQNECLK